MVRKEKLCKCGCGQRGLIWAKGMLKSCYMKLHPYKPIKKSKIRPKTSDSRREKIKANNKYYLDAILRNKEKNGGICRCDECGEEIKHPTGRNVAHIIGSGANLALYHKIDNHLILGKGDMFGECNCLFEFDESGRWQQMKVAEHVKEVKQRLTAMYYDNKKAP